MKKLKNSGGFTVLELTITLVISSILIMSTVMFFSFTYKMFFANQEADNQRFISNTIISELEEGLSYASEVTIAETSSMGNKYSFKNGVLEKNGEVFLGNEFYQGYTFEGKFNRANRDILKLEMKMSDAEGVILNITYMIKILNISGVPSSSITETVKGGSTVFYR